MDIHNCQFCGHGNAADAKYCSECGGCLYLVPCPDCGVVNDVKAISCYQCHRQLQAGSAGAKSGVPPVAVVAKPAGPDLLSRALDVEVAKLEPVLSSTAASEVTPRTYRKYAPAIVATAVLGLAGLGYYGYRHQGFPGATSPPAAGGEARARTTPASAGVMRGDSAAATAVVPAAAAPAAAASTEVSAAVNAVSPPPVPAEPVKAGKGDPPRPDACNDAAAALGLCASVSAVPATPPVTHTLRKE